MNGELALMATLAAIGGRWLRDGAKETPPDFMSGNSSFQYVGSFTAAMPPQGLRRQASTATSPEDWLIALRSRGITDLSLITDVPTGGPLTPHIASAFSNSGIWVLLATGTSAPTVWTLRSEVGEPNASDSRIWSLTAMTGPGEDVRAPHVDIAQARDGLRMSLHEIRTFAEGFDELSNWPSWFTKAENLLDDRSPTAPYHQDLLPDDAALERRQLAASVVQAWVFGGMGSWNDAWLPDDAAQREYEQVSSSLFMTLLTALPAAVNGA